MTSRLPGKIDVITIALTSRAPAETTSVSGKRRLAADHVGDVKPGLTERSCMKKRLTVRMNKELYDRVDDFMRAETNHGWLKKPKICPTICLLVDEALEKYKKLAGKKGR